MTFEAKYNGKCGNEDCERAIRPGDEVLFDTEHNLVHANCEERIAAEPKGTPCAVCFCYHAGECI